MKNKIIVLILSLATCLAVESGLHAAAIEEPPKKEKITLTKVQTDAAKDMAMSIYKDNPSGVDSIFNDFFLTDLLAYKDPTQARSLIDEIIKNLQGYGDFLLKSLQNNAGTHFRNRITQIEPVWQKKEVKSSSHAWLEKLSPPSIALILAESSDSQLAKMAQRSISSYYIVQPELIRRNNTAYRWGKCQITGKNLTGHTREVLSLAFSPNGKILASGSEDNAIILWDAQTGKDIGRLIGNTEPVVFLEFSSDGNTLVSLTKDRYREEGTVRLWDIKTREFKNSLAETDISSVAFSPDSETLASATDGAISFWNVQTGELKRVWDVFGTKLVTFSSNGKILASFRPHQFTNKEINLWNADTGELKTIGVESLQEITTQTEAGSLSYVFSPDCKLLALGAGDEAFVWNVETGKLKNQLVGHKGNVNAVAFSADGKLLASGSSDGTVRLWDIETSNSIELDMPNKAVVLSVAFSRDGKKIAVGLHNGIIKIIKAGGINQQ